MCACVCMSVCVCTQSPSHSKAVTRGMLLLLLMATAGSPLSRSYCERLCPEPRDERVLLVLMGEAGGEGRGPEGGR